MAERDDVGREQISAVCRRVDDLEHEIHREHGIRKRLHTAENMLTAHKLYVEMVPDLVAWKNKTTGAVIVASAVVSAATAWLVKLIG